MITRFEVGDKVILTEDNLKTIKNGNRSILCYPSDSYIKKIEKYLGKSGVITHTFKPGYEVTVRFNEESFHAKDNYITKER